MRVSRISPLPATLLIAAMALVPAGVAAHGSASTTTTASGPTAADVTIPPLLATVGPTGGNSSSNPIWMVTSADGSHVVYRTREALTADDTNSLLDLYDWSEADGVRLITAGTTTDQGYEATRISSDGEHVFVYTPDPLLPEDVDLDTDVYEWSQGILTLASTSPSDTGAGFNYPLGTTPDGGTLYFYSSGSLAPEDTDISIDIYKRTAGIVSLLSVTATAGNGPHGVTFNGMSADGSHLFFQTAEQLDPADTDTVYDLYEWSASGVVLVSTGPTDTGAADGAYLTSTADGSRVYFSTIGQMTTDDTDGNGDTYERSGGLTRLVSRGPAGEEAGNYARVWAASDDGSRLILDVAGSLTSGDTDGSIDTYLLVNGTPTLLMDGLDEGLTPLINGVTADLSRIVFSTNAALVGSDTDGAMDIYIHTDAGNEHISWAPGDPNLGLDAEFYGMSTDGLRVFFRSGEPLDVDDVNSDYDIAIWDDGDIARLPIPGSGRLIEYNGSSTNGERLFVRTGVRLASSDTDSSYDIYQFSLPDLPQSAPGAPTGVSATGGDQQATVTWTGPADDGGSPITEYTITSTPGAITTTAGGAATSAILTGLTNGFSYTFTVAATNAVGTGPTSLPSNAVTPLAKANQTITFGNLQNRTMLQSPVAVSASATSGLAVAFSTSTPTVCTAGGSNGATITLVGAGTCIVRADQVGDAAYNPAPPVSRNFAVSRVSQTITFGALSNRTMLQTPFVMSATASSGLAVTFASTTPSTCATGGLNGSTVTLLLPGTCAITASQAGDATYSPAPDRPRSFAITLAAQTITFSGISNKTMVQSPVTASPTSSSGLPVTVTTSTPAVCLPDGSDGHTVTLVAPGTCSLLANQVGNGAYAAAPQKAVSFTVSRAGQAITFTNPGNKTLIQSPLNVTATASSGLIVTFTTTTPAVCTSSGPDGSTVTLVATGSCSVVASQAGNANYAPATSITRTLTVSLAAQTITFAALPTANLLQSPIQVSATASSGLTVSFTTSSASVCTAGGVNGATITLLKAGTCRVVASQGGNAMYRPAPNITRSFTVSTAKLAQTITFDALGSRSIGELPLALTASATSGLQVTYTVAAGSSSICSVSGAVLTLEHPGSCTVAASQPGDAIYQVATPVTQTLTATLGGFVQASGPSLVLDGEPFQIFGAAIYQTSNYGHTADPDEVFGWAADANLNTIRLTDIFNQTTNDPGAPYAEADWQWIDGLIARAGDAGMKVILDLSSYRNWLVWSSQIDHGWVVNCQPFQDRTPVDYAALDPYTVAHRADWTAFMTFVANRVNTVTGITYRKDPTILVVSIAGEPVGAGYGECGKASSEQELTDFFVWALAEWKSLDPHHLRSTGGLHGTYAGLDGNGDPIASGQLVDGIALFGLADNTLPSLHTYPPQTTQLPLADGQTPVLAPVAHALGKPWFTEEFGFRQEEGDAFRATEFDAIYEAQIAYGSVGSLFWNLGPEIGVGTFDVNPSTPLTWARILAEAP